MIPFFILLFFVGIPIFFLETAIGQFSGLSPRTIFENIAPIFQGLGYAAVLINSIIGFYYNVLIVYIVHFFIMSLRAKLKWADCSYFEAEKNICFQIKNYTDKSFCQLERATFARENGGIHFLCFCHLKFVRFVSFFLIYLKLLRSI